MKPFQLAPQHGGHQCFFLSDTEGWTWQGVAEYLEDSRFFFLQNTAIRLRRAMHDSVNQLLGMTN